MWHDSCLVSVKVMHILLLSSFFFFFLLSNLWVSSELLSALCSCCSVLREPGDLSDCPSFVATSLPLFNYSPATADWEDDSEAQSLILLQNQPAVQLVSLLTPPRVCGWTQTMIVVIWERADISPQKMIFFFWFFSGAHQTWLSLGVGFQISSKLLWEIQREGWR